MTEKIITQNTGLIKYDAACRAIAEAKSVDEVKGWHDKGKAMEMYAKQANNRSLQADAMEITLRAERKLGELLATTPKAIGGGTGANKHRAAGAKTEPPATTTPTLEDMGISKKLSARSQKTAKVDTDSFEAVIDSAREKIISPEVTHVSSGNNDWYTPEEYIVSAREVLGGIDTDPASSDVAQKTIKANDHYTISNSGLDKTWSGGVWLNPPYSHPEVENFTSKVISEYEAGNISAAIILVNNATDTKWFHALLAGSMAFCIVRGRINFINEAGDQGLATRQGQFFFYIGNEAKSFCEVFKKYGEVFYV